jgi:hypothetical protein
MSVIAKVKLERLEGGNWAATIKDWNIAVEADNIDGALVEIQEKALDKFKDEFSARRRVFSEIDSIKATAEISIWGNPDSNLFEFSTAKGDRSEYTIAQQLIAGSEALPEGGEINNSLPIFTLRCCECGEICHVNAHDFEEASERDCKCGGRKWVDLTEEYSEDLEE